MQKRFNNKFKTKDKVLCTLNGIDLRLRERRRKKKRDEKEKNRAKNRQGISMTKFIWLHIQIGMRSRKQTARDIYIGS